MTLAEQLKAQLEALKPVIEEDRVEDNTPRLITKRSETDGRKSIPNARIDLAQQIRFHMRTGGGRMSLLLPDRSAANSDLDSDEESAKESSASDSASD